VQVSDHTARELDGVVTSCGHIHCPKDWHLGPDRTLLWPDLDLWVLVEGHGTLEAEGTLHSLEPGSCALLRGGEPYTFTQDPDHRFRHYWVHFRFVDANGETIPHGDLALPPLLRRLHDLPFVEKLLARLIRSHRQARSWRQTWSWLRTILNEIDSEDQRAESRRRSPHAEALDAICARMREHPDENHRVDDFARELGLDPSYFSRLFRTHTGQSPRRFLTNARMQLARFLLRDSQLTIARIAERTGYADARFFARHFREQHGLSPSAYRTTGATRSAGPDRP
jgi:AraC-like DNA-binding protein